MGRKRRKKNTAKCIYKKNRLIFKNVGIFLKKINEYIFLPAMPLITNLVINKKFGNVIKDDSFELMVILFIFVDIALFDEIDRKSMVYTFYLYLFVALMKKRFFYSVLGSLYSS